MQRPENNALVQAIQIAGGLVQQQKRRVVQERPGKPQPLPLPAAAEAWKLNRGLEFAPGADASLDADGKRLLLPRVRSRTEMDWVEIPSLSLLQPGAYGIPEPPADRPAADPGRYAATLALIPCLAAGTDGVRLGRGGGYYDRFLAQYKGERLLLCPAAALLADLPADDWDARFAPDEILTEKGILR